MLRTKNRPNKNCSPLVHILFPLDWLWFIGFALFCFRFYRIQSQNINASQFTLQSLKPHSLGWIAQLT